MSLPARTVADPLAQLNFEYLGRMLYRGQGSPVGAVPAGVGAIYLRTDGGAGSTLYVKETAPNGPTDPNGWVAK